MLQENADCHLSRAFIHGDFFFVWKPLKYQGHLLIEYANEVCVNFRLQRKNLPEIVKHRKDGASLSFDVIHSYEVLLTV